MPKDSTKSGKEAPLDSYRALQQRLAQLGPPPAGRIRVFRGQTEDFGKMLASGLRGKPLRSEMLLHAYTRLVAEDLLSGVPHEQRPEEIDIWAFWVQAIAQHYGPGSRFLDVTHSVDVALWFALHERVGLPGTAVIGPPGPPDPEQDTSVSEIWTRHRPWIKEPGWLYVFDVPKWTGQGLPGHGVVLDLAEAPAIFASSERIKAQQGCLLAADPQVGQGDLSTAYACAPLRVLWPSDGPAFLEASANAVFPVPSRDNWYARFISIPVVAQIDSASKTLKFGHPLPVTLYDPEEDAEQQVMGGMISALRPRFVFPGAPAAMAAGTRAGGSEWWQSFKVEDATPILLDGLFQFSTPPAESDLWNQDLLSGDLADTVDAADVVFGTSAPVSLRNVFFEFSPLDRAGWERVERPDGGLRVLRGMWLVRDGTRLAVHFFFFSYPGGGQIAGPLAVEFDSGTRRFRYWANRQPPGWADMVELPLLAKPLFVALNILRQISPHIKAAAVPSLATQSDDKRTFFVDVHGAAARLVRATDAQTGQAWYVLRQIDADEPFIGAVRHTSALKVESLEPWSQFDAASLRESIAQNLAAFTASQKNPSAA